MILLFLVLIPYLVPVLAQTPPEFYMGTQEIAEYYGYPLENHPVHTSDGYIINLMRIPYGPESDNLDDRPPILLLHSSAHNAGFLLFHGPEESPGFYFVNRGYDVWLMNMRGVSTSTGHETLDWRTDFDYWNFTWTELNNDYVASIQYIIDHTPNYERIPVMSMMLNSPAMLIGLTSDPEWYSQRVTFVSFLSPTVSYGIATAPFVK